MAQLAKLLPWTAQVMIPGFWVGALNWAPGQGQGEGELLLLLPLSLPHGSLLLLTLSQINKLKKKKKDHTLDMIQCSVRRQRCFSTCSSPKWHMGTEEVSIRCSLSSVSHFPF